MPCISCVPCEFENFMYLSLLLLLRVSSVSFSLFLFCFFHVVIKYLFIIVQERNRHRTISRPILFCYIRSIDRVLHLRARARAHVCVGMCMPCNATATCSIHFHVMFVYSLRRFQRPDRSVVRPEVPTACWILCYAASFYP